MKVRVDSWTGEQETLQDLDSAKSWSKKHLAQWMNDDDHIGWFWCPEYNRPIGAVVINSVAEHTDAEICLTYLEDGA